MFYVFCAKHRIVLHEDLAVREGGLYLRYAGRPHIFLDRDLRGHEKTRCAWHEAGHFLLHPEGIQFFRGMDSIVDYEAEVVAVCAMLPATLLRSHWPSEIVDEFGYSAELVEFRQEIFAIWGL